MEKTTLLAKNAYFFVVFFLIQQIGIGQTQTFTANSSWICPAGVTSVTAEAWGAGGAGGGATGNPSAGGGGAGGAYVKNNSISVTPGLSYTITVGATTMGNTGNGASGNPTSFALTSNPSVLLINAVGGNGGSASTADYNSATGATAVNTGNIGGSASSIYGAAGLQGTGTAGSKSGSGGASGGGASGGSGTTSTTPNAGSIYGGGGSGGRANSSTDRNGGNGAAGKLILNWIPPQEINIQGYSTTITSGDTSPSIDDGTDFGSAQIISSPIQKTFTIQNTGGTTLTVSTISISGIDASDFTVTTAPSSSILAGGSSTLVLTFNPTVMGTKTASISIINNDGDENPYTFDIKGSGIQSYFDSDGDGVFDNVDVDDDNDGILDVTEENNCNNSNGHKVDYKFLYETFGTGSRTTINTTYNAITSYSYQDESTPTDVEGSGMSLDLNDGKYTVGSSAQIASWASQYWYLGTDHTGNTNGRMAIFNASYTPGIFYTASITGALPNIPITYSFWVLNLDRSDAPGVATRLRPNIRVEFRDVNDVILATINTGAIAPTTNGNLAGDWYQFTANLTINVDAFKVIFINNETGGLGNDLALDDILITQTLCDFDGDGVADVFDLDADNDGIPDVVEVGLGNLSNGKAKIDVPWVDANGNGLNDAAEATAALPALDSDGDGQPNYIDLDSDNDSLFDVDESGVGNMNAASDFVNGDGDINGDGTGDGPETETFRSKDTDGDSVLEGFGDGILDIFDYGTTGTFSNQYGNSTQGTDTGNPATTYLKDTDGDGIPDYLDVMSNGLAFDIANTIKIYDYKTLDANNDGIIDGNLDIDHDGILDAFDTNTSNFGSPRDLDTKLLLDFDGRNDYGQSTAILGGLSNASLMAWIDLNPTFSTEGVIVGQDQFQIRITSAKKLEAVLNGTTLTYNSALNVSQWYNVGVTFDGSALKLYLNGVLVATQAVSGAIAADVSLLTIGKNPSTNTSYFKGKMDEIRVFNSALTDSQLQRMVYQEIKNFDSEIRGEVIPKNISTTPDTLPFANLLRYYRMDTYKDDIIDDLTTLSVDLTGTKIYNFKNIYVQQAPMPFVTERTGNFATAVNCPTNDIRGMDIVDNNYSIVHVKDNITETSNTIDLGMIVDSENTVIMNNDTKIQNDWYLKLDGKIDLAGKSQLVQTTESDLDETSAGFIERDQQGQSNIYNYNYWSSPVNPVNSTSNNTDYRVDSVLQDGTNPTSPTNINWIDGYDGAPTIPISLARYWLYTFDNYINEYANWNQILETTPIRVGQGFTMKGSGAEGTIQNYTFVGKPNNGLIDSNTVAADQLLLTGNPYPSAIDATAFINDNINSIDGTLYFWEHYDTNGTHILREYQGGYAERNLVGGLPPVAPTLISGLGSSTRIPAQFIPVGQGFLVIGKNSFGGNVIFNNSQRAFHKEDETNISNIMFKTKSNSKTQNKNNNNNDSVAKDTIMKIRLGFNSSNMYHRQVLLGFMNEKASDGMDDGYDALNFDNFPNDMYFLNKKKQLVIQGVGYFDTEASYPIGVKTTNEGTVSFILDSMENFDSSQSVFIYDNLTDTYHNIRNEKFELQMTVGVNNTRFSLHFKDKSLKTEQNSINDAIQIHLQKNNVLIINNHLLDVKLEKISLYNLLGQTIKTWKIEDQEQQVFQIPITNVSSGIYITKIFTSKGEINKKIIIP